MSTALYYPYAQINNESIIKTGLILWDKLEYISPWTGHRQESDNPKFQQALELISKPFVPTDQIKRLVHEEVRQLIEQELPEWFWAVPDDADAQYQMYPEKMLNETWDMLRRARFAIPTKAREHEPFHGAQSEYSMSQSVGLTLMSILADVMAGGTKRLVTDRGDSYAALNKFITRAKRGTVPRLSQTPAEEQLTTDSGFAQLVSISLSTLSVDQIAIDQLIKLREREITSNDTLLKELRRNYYTRLDGFTKTLAEDVEHEGDYFEVLSSFQAEAEADLRDLKRELRLDAKKALLTKEVWATFLASPLLGLITPALGGSSAFLGVLGVFKAFIDYKEARRKTLKQHPMAWLYLTKPSKIYG